MAESGKLGQLYVDIIAKMDKFGADLKEAKGLTDTHGKAMQDRFDKVRGSVLGLSKAVVAFVTGSALVRLGKQFVETAAAAENYQTRLEVLLQSQQQGARMFQVMAEYASRVPFEFYDIMEAATALAGVMRGGVDEVQRWMPLVGDLAAATGLSIQDTTSQIIRMYSAGAASADLFRERGVLAMLGFQAGTSYTAKATRDQLIKAWEDVDSKFRGATDRLADNWDGKVSMMADAWTRFSEGMGKNIIESSIPTIELLTRKLNTLADTINRVGREREAFNLAQEVVNKAMEASAGLGGEEGLLVDTRRKALIEKVQQVLLDAKAEADRMLAEDAEKNKGAGEEDNAAAIAAARKKYLEAQSKTEGDVYAGDYKSVEEQIQDQLEAEAQKWERIMEYKEELKQREIDKVTEWEELEAEAYTRGTQLRVQAETRAAQQLLTLQSQTEEAKQNLMKASVGAILSIAGVGAKETFLIMKAMDIGIAIVSAHAAAAKALAEVPWPYNLAVSSQMLTLGYIQAAAIAATALGTAFAGGGGGGGGSATPVATVTPAFEPSYSLEDEEDQKKGSLNIYLYGDMLADPYYIELLAEKINEGVEDRNVRLIATESKTAEALA